MLKKIVLPSLLALAFVLCLTAAEKAVYHAASVPAARCVSAGIGR